jgi:hypothetical protein
MRDAVDDATHGCATIWQAYDREETRHRARERAIGEVSGIDAIDRSIG